MVGGVGGGSSKGGTLRKDAQDSARRAEKFRLDHVWGIYTLPVRGLEARNIVFFPRLAAGHCYTSLLRGGVDLCFPSNVTPFVLSRMTGCPYIPN